MRGAERLEKREGRLLLLLVAWPAEQLAARLE